MKYIIANWKANKNIKEAKNWVEKFNKFIKSNKNITDKLKNNELIIIVCPSFHLIYPVKQKLIKLPNILLGAQDVSFFERGSYTGEVPASILSGLVDYVIIGHSERRKYFEEKDSVVDQKATLALNHGLKPIVCIRGSKDLIPKGVKIVAYEPVWAIGTGKNEPLDNVLSVKKTLKLEEDSLFLYGGSVNEKNIESYKSEEMDGFLVGSASNNPTNFYKMACLV